MISRHWRARPKAGQAANTIHHFMTVTFPRVSEIPGFVRASILSRPSDGRTEFLIVTEWASLEAIPQFAGDDAERAVLPAEVVALMDDYDERAVHYEMAQRYAPPSV